MIKSIFDTVTLNNGVKMPAFGLGVYKVEDGSQVVETISTALQLGYRLIDTAAFYENEEGVGRAIKDSGIPREEIFITTKVWNTDQGYESTLKAFDESIRKLGLDYIDLYLIHWPVKGKYIETWRALEKLYKEGKVRAIGVSNFKEHHIDDLVENCSEKPAVNQVELHPLLSQEGLREYCLEKDIKVEAWSPLSRGRFFDQPILQSIAADHKKTPAQVILRWHLQNGVIAIPKSVTPARQKENADIFDFELSEKVMELINGLNRDERFGADPDHFDF